MFAGPIGSEVVKASEMLEKLNSNDEWPKWDEKYLIADTAEVVIQINGKLRAKLSVSIEDLENEEKIISLAKEDEIIKKYLLTEPKKIIFIKKAKLLNFVI